MSEILKKYRIQAKKSLGQNFLVDEKLLSSVVATFDITDKHILEVGPGYGALTEKILENNPKSLTLVELDEDMVHILEDRKKNADFAGDFEIISQDILSYKPKNYRYSVVANIPYYITSPILRHFLYTIKNTPESMLILMQKDVGDKILAGYQKKRKNSVLSLYIQKKMNCREVAFVPRTAFVPAPKVDSSFLYFEAHGQFSAYDDTKFLELVKLAFSSPRKMLIKNLSVRYDKVLLQKHFSELEIDEKIRPEKLEIEQYLKLQERLESGI